MQQINKYPIEMRIMHWLIGIVILGMIVVGLYMTSDIVNPQSRGNLYNLHKSFGLIVIVMVIIRIIVRLRSKIPQLPDQISLREKKLATSGHHTMYLLMALIPVSGFLMSELGGYPVKLFAIELPHFLPKNPAASKFFNTTHTVLNYALILMIAVHLSAPFKHLLFDKVNIWKRMM